MGTHDVQKRTAGTRDARPAAPLRPARPFTVPAPAPSVEGAPDPAARVDRAARFGHDFSRIAVRSRAAAPVAESAPDTAPSAPAPASPQGGVIQRKGPRDAWNWIKEKLGYESGDQQPLLPQRNPQFRRNIMEDPFGGHQQQLEENRQLADQASSSFVPEKVSIGGSIASGGTSGAGKVADVIKLAGLSGGQVVSDATAGGGGALTAIGGLVDAGVNVRDLAVGGLQTGDKLETASKLGSNLGKSVANTGLALQQGGQVLGSSALSSAASAVGPAVAPAAIAMGGLDMVGGAYGAYRAHGRQKALGNLAETGSTSIKGIAEFARNQQTTKRNVNQSRILQGGLGVAGGVTLLAAGLSNPVGWGLLGAAGLVAGGAALYKQYRKYQEGKKLLHDDQYRARLGLSDLNPQERGKFDNQIAPRRWWNTIKAHDDIRGQIGHQLVEGWPHDNTEKAAVRENIGVKALPHGTLDNATEEEKNKRAAQIARALSA